MLAIKNQNKAYEQSQKEQLGALCNNPNMPWSDIMSFVRAEDEKSRRMSNIRQSIVCFKEDGVYQLNQAIREIIGVAQATEESAGPSSDRAANLETVDVQLADGTRVKVPYGKIDLPDAGEDAHIDIAYDQSTTTLHVKGTCQFRFSPVIDSIIARTRELLNTQSIYKDQAFELDANYRPKIMNLSNIDKEFMVMSDETEMALRPLMARITRADECKAKGIPLKYGTLLAGPYGTGKTLAAFKIAKDAIANNWSFIYLKEPKLLAQTLKMSQTLDNNGHGIIIFLEDVDQIVTGNRDAQMQDILNTLDGGDTKHMNVICIFTTNHLEKINETFLRGKRIGSVIHMEHLDAKTARQFIEYTFKDEYTLAPEGLDEVCAEIESYEIVPAFMAEITEKVKAHMVFEDNTQITATHIRASLKSYLTQVGLARTKPSNESATERFARSFREVMLEVGVVKEIADRVDVIHQNL